jgi:DNA-binding GntR family transcriptional regulator
MDVARLTANNLQEIFLIREGLESTALRQAVPRVTDADLANAEEAFDRIDADPDPTHMAELNWEFHEAIYRAANMPRLLSMARTLNNNALPTINSATSILREGALTTGTQTTFWQPVERAAKAPRLRLCWIILGVPLLSSFPLTVHRQ